MNMNAFSRTYFIPEKPSFTCNVMFGVRFEIQDVMK